MKKFQIGFCANIKIDKSNTPVQRVYRQIPIPLEELTVLNLKELERQGVIERVTKASELVSSLLVKRKSADDVRNSAEQVRSLGHK